MGWLRWLFCCFPSKDISKDDSTQPLVCCDLSNHIDEGTTECCMSSSNDGTYMRKYEDLRVFREMIPPKTMNIIITECNMREFDPCHGIPSHVASIDLSYNVMESIPRAIYEFYARNPRANINLYNNRFWYCEYSNLSPSRITPDTIDELIFANKINLVSSYKIEYARRELYERYGMNIDHKIKDLVRIKQKDDGATWANEENTHLSSIEKSCIESIEKIKESYDTLYASNTVKFYPIKKMLDLLETSDAVNKFLYTMLTYTVKHDQFKISYYNLFYMIFYIAMHHPNRSDIFAVLRKEIEDSIDTCLTGQMTRLVNSLAGFVDGIKISISPKEELSNKIIATRKKYAEMYGHDNVTYFSETIPVIWQLLEDACIPDHQHAAWLEYV